VGDSRVGQQLTLSLLDELLWFEKLTGCVAMSHMKGDTITVRLDDDLLPILDEVHALPLDALLSAGQGVIQRFHREKPCRRQPLRNVQVCP
jgi:hypothetical protein